MDRPLAQRVRLPAERRSPLRARRILRDALHEAGLDDLSQDALLLTSELCENAVLHAGTAFELIIEVSGPQLTVTVIDHGQTPMEIQRGRPRPAIEGISAHGRGLVLVDAIASAWGTRHDAEGHQVWFTMRLGGPVVAGESADEPDGRVVDTAPADGTSVGDGASGPVALDWPDTKLSRWLLHLGAEVVNQAELAPQVSELARRLCDVLDGDGVAVWVDYADGAGELELASVGQRPDGGSSITVPLPLSPPLTGRLRAGVRPGRRAAELAALSAQRVALAVEADWMRASQRHRWSWMTYLGEASELLAHSLDVELTAALVPQLVVPRVGSWCAVHLIDEHGQLGLAAMSHVDEARLPALRAGLLRSQSQLHGLLRSGSGVVGITAPSEGIAVPIVARGQPLGTLSVGRPGQRAHTPDELLVISDLARRAAPALDNARRNAANVATSQALQDALLPPELPVADGIEFAAVYLPASTGTDVGGDFYDVLRIDADRWLLAIGDVCGKGAVAAARTSLVRDVLRVLVRDGRSPARALELLNETMLDADDPHQFATVVLAVITQDPGENGLSVELVLAGHEQPVLVRADGSSTLVGRHGTAAGLVSEFTVHPTKHRLDPGDVLVTYTDGVTERRRGEEEFGQDRVLEALAGAGGGTAASIVGELRQAVVEFSAEPKRDDIAMIAVRAT